MVTAAGQLALNIVGAAEPSVEALISVRDQKLAVLRDGAEVAVYKISTSRYGLGDDFGSYKTPTGTLLVSEKIGDRLPAGAVFKNRRFTGEVLPPNAPGRDPIVTRIISLRGSEQQNRNAGSRCIYIHGTTEERNIGRKASFGCIRMRSEDVIALFNMLPVGAAVTVSERPLKVLVAEEHRTLASAADHRPTPNASRRPEN